MDKTSFFFAQNCGVCHPGAGPLQYDRDGRKYFDRASGKFKVDPADVAGTGVLALDPADALSGDYGLVNAAGAAVTAPWKTTGVAEADCLMCHLQGYSWKHRAAVMTSGSALVETGTAASLPAFELAPTAGAGWASVTFCGGTDPCAPKPGSPPKAKDAKVAYPASMVNAAGYLEIPRASLVAAPDDANCTGCHATPDRRKSGRSWQPDTDVHKAAGLGCVSCHPSGTAARDGRISQRGTHDFGKGDATIGSVRDELDGTVVSCVACHLEGEHAAAKDPTAAHASIPPLHFEKMRCQVCHVRYLQDSALTAAAPAEVPDVFIDMATNGSQAAKVSTDYFKTDPLDPTKDLEGLSGVQLTRWYPTVKLYRGKLTTVKPLFTSWVGDWLDGFGDTARVRPVTLRHVRKMVKADAAGAVQSLNLATLLDGAVNTRAELRAYLQEFASPAVAVDGTTPIFIGRPVIVRAGQVWYLDARGELASFESVVAESHDFGVNHNVVPRRDPASPVATPGPWGATGCAECHAPGSAFFRGKELVDPAGPDGAPVYEERWHAMGYSPQYVATLTAGVPVTGAPGAQGPAGETGAAGSEGARGKSGGCASGGAAGLLALAGAALALARRRRG